MAWIVPAGMKKTSPGSTGTERRTSGRVPSRMRRSTSPLVTGRESRSRGKRRDRSGGYTTSPSFPVLPPSGGVVFIGMDLYGKVPGGVDELHEQRESPPRRHCRPGRPGVAFQKGRQGLPAERSAGDHRFTVRMGGQFPALGDPFRAPSLSEEGGQPVSAPQVVLVRRKQQKRRSVFRHSGNISDSAKAQRK